MRIHFTNKPITTWGGLDTIVAKLLEVLEFRSWVESAIPIEEKSNNGEGIFPKELFTYHRDTDTFTCPAGNTFKRRNYHKKRNHYEYKALCGICAQCHLREHCTRAKNVRTVKRHARQDELDSILQRAKSREAKRDL